MTFRKDSNWPTRGTPVVIHKPSKQPTTNRSTDEETIRRWPIVVIYATCMYLSEGIRVLGQSYSEQYDDRGSQ